MAKISMSDISPELTPEELQELEAAEKMPVIFDEDCPEMTEKMLQQFHRFRYFLLWDAASAAYLSELCGRARSARHRPPCAEEALPCLHCWRWQEIWDVPAGQRW